MKAMSSELVARTVKLAAQIHEENWDDKAKKYLHDEYACASMACHQNNLDSRMSAPIGLLLTQSWNDALLWADEILAA